MYKQKFQSEFPFRNICMAFYVPFKLAASHDGGVTILPGCTRSAGVHYQGRWSRGKAWKKVEPIATDPETGEETSTIELHQRYIYRGYLQVAACDLTRGGHPCLWLIVWDPTQPTATRPLAIQRDGTW